MNTVELPTAPPTFEEAVRTYEIAAADLEAIDREVAGTSATISKLYEQLTAQQARQRAARGALKHAYVATLDAAKREWPLPLSCQNA
jgi:hypothetical protein